jgi:hypothetical protein
LFDALLIAARSALCTLHIKVKIFGMVRSKYTDTIIWTYDRLLNEAKERSHKDLLVQCTMLDLPAPQPL